MDDKQTKFELKPGFTDKKAHEALKSVLEILQSNINRYRDAQDRAVTSATRIYYQYLIMHDLDLMTQIRAMIIK